MLSSDACGPVATTDFLVIGGGVIGLCLALNLKRRYGDCTVMLIEKESGCGRHASGRNSGVLHAGFYYGPDSWKARFTLDGNRALKDYCRDRGIPVNRTGKLVVARDETELPGLHHLLERGRANGVPLDLVTEDEARRIEPRVKTFGHALYSPETATVDPRRVVAAFAADAEASGVVLRPSTAYLGRRQSTVLTTGGAIDAGHVVNAAGVYADTVARDFGFAQEHAILPFKGLYLRSSEPTGSLKTNVYPVPDPAYPFLGAHFTVGPEGGVTLGPTAIPALWREQYRGWGGFEGGELRAVLRLCYRLWRSDPSGYTRLALTELRCCFRPYLVREAARLVDGVRAEHFRVWGEAGIRAQLVNLETGRLEPDFRFEGDERSSHVLNAVSPAFTCALPFSAYLVDRIPGRGTEARAARPV
ncbi:MAG: L-2-hydroxyglutarate oxidase [Gammaproteobacteria bacterium]